MMFLIGTELILTVCFKLFPSQLQNYNTNGVQCMFELSLKRGTLKATGLMHLDFQAPKGYFSHEKCFLLHCATNYMRSQILALWYIHRAFLSPVLADFRLKISPNTWKILPSPKSPEKKVRLYM